ncbi:pentapeptide repeat-containing protein [Blastococcus sp. TML/M2B]|uniref:pentapeptide repeat-containing protein n=1 Tax=unclassified Blastococcus TaxID=2619396 RepID=UPI00190BF322|nr:MULTISPECIES: pentapeptide repeat-containing protein [unclassified Blastococcus]MBN1092811.1 pentapeptide repeat-containing protein [Blastococcus sp. TML/M2B]MBN1097082.1 pentapeptide repeat-containing protein [Blastococcus sp. TML/C7B]
MSTAIVVAVGVTAVLIAVATLLFPLPRRTRQPGHAEAPRRREKIRQRLQQRRPLLLTYLGLVVMVAVVAVIWVLPAVLTRHPHLNEPAERHQAIADTRTGLVAMLVALGAAGGLAYTARTYRLSREGQITDRYSKAVEQLGSDKLEVRLGGIYALERLMHDSPTDQPTIMEALTAYVRHHAPRAPGEAPPVRERRVAGHRRRHTPAVPEHPAEDVQAVVTVLGRRRRVAGENPIELPVTMLRRARLDGAYLAGAQLYGADMTGAQLDGAELTEAHLDGADLTGAWLFGADLNGAQLLGADLTGAQLLGADLTGARLDGANLTGATLHNTILTGARLVGAKLPGAVLPDSDLRGRNFQRATLTDAMFARSNLSDAQFAGADLTGATLSAADLRGAFLYDAKLVGAHLVLTRLHNADLCEADLTGADLHDAKLVGTQLPRARLANANLLRADLTDADLTGADLTGANLTEADLTNARLTRGGLSAPQMAGARNVDRIRWYEKTPDDE